MSCPAATASAASLDAGMSAASKTFFIGIAQRATAPQLDGFVALFSPCPAGQTGMPPNCFALKNLPGSVVPAVTASPSYPLAAALAAAQAACLRANGPVPTSCPAVLIDPNALDAGLTTDQKIALIATAQQATAAQLSASFANSAAQYPLSSKLATEQAACLQNPSLAVPGASGTGWWASQSSTAKAEIVGGAVVVVGLIAFTVYHKRRKS